MLEKSDAATGRRLFEIKSMDKRVEANGLLFRDGGSTPPGSNRKNLEVRIQKSEVRIQKTQKTEGVRSALCRAS